MNFLLPLLTLVLCASFLIFQQVSVQRISTGNSALQTRIDQTRQAATPGLAGPAATSKSGARRGTGPADGENADGSPDSVADIDLEELARSMMEAETSGGRNFEVMVRMKSLLLEATPEELTDLIRRTAELEVPLRVKENLLGEMVDALAQHDPKLALEVALSSPHLDLNRQRWRISSTFAKWAKEDPASAAAWFDRETAKGSFESRSLGEQHRGAHIECEGALIAQFLSIDPTQARNRLLQLSPEERQQVLSRGDRFDIDDNNAGTYAQLVRESIDEADRGAVLGSAAAKIVQKDGFPGVLEYTEQINASPAEREGIAQQAAGQKFERMGWERKTPSPTDIAELDTFLQSEAPQDASRITGESLAKYGRTRDNFQSALALVEQLHTQTPSDDLLAGFLQSSHVRKDSHQAARELAAKIQDPQQREAALERIK